MNDLHHAPSSRGVPHVEASANAGSVNTSTSRAPGAPTRTEQIQVPRSPQPLSLHLDGLHSRFNDKASAFPSYVESSERDSDTSADARRPEPQSASTFTDSLSSIPSSSTNDHNQSIKIENSQSSTEDAQTPKTYSDSQEQFSVNGSGSIDGYTSEKKGSVSLSPRQSPKSSTSQSTNEVHFAPGHKRTATGDVKSISSFAAPQAFDPQAAARRRSKSTGSSAHGSRIAQLSVHIRTRLSYAAAKIEKSRQSRDNKTQLAIQGLESLSSASPPIPNGATQGATPTSHPQASSSTPTPRNFPSHNRSQSAISSGKLLQVPKLAPPVDIISSAGDTRRRRPNPNTATKPFERSPYTRHHRRHHSVQEPSLTKTLGSPPMLEPGTPHVPPLHACRYLRSMRSTDLELILKAQRWNKMQSRHLCSCQVQKILDTAPVRALFSLSPRNSV
ncbi:hypothetical protein N7454_008896 [Penicillium verhagenii]|nr:hypothetical protein N7454_008896 [Penicillium verhagenii]